MLIGHKKQWEFLKKKFELDQLSHAYLFAGAEQIGKKALAREFIKFINCLSPTNFEVRDGEEGFSMKKKSKLVGDEDGKKPCGKCSNCQMIERESFPDFKLIEKKEGKNEIEILQIKGAQNFLSYKSYYGSFKTVIIDDAEKMNQEAQSCFLKTLEEPKGKTVLFLISSKPDMLLPTIVSRCQVVKFFRPENLPLNAEKTEKEQKILKDLISVINSDFSDKFKYVKSLDFEQQNPAEILEVMQKYLRHLLLIKSGVGTIKDNEYFLGRLAPTRNYSLPKIKEAINLTEDINKKLLFTNINPKLALEILLINI